MSAVGLLALFVALAVSSLLLVTVLAAVWFFDRYDREPLHLVVAVFVWGATAAPALAITAVGSLTVILGGGDSTALDAAVAPVVLAPLVEEVLKAVAIVGVILISRDFDNPTDGIVYGTAVGLGFAVTENALYGLSASTQPTAEIVALLVGRTFFSAGVHALSSSAFGGFAGLAKLEGRRLLRPLWLLLGVVVAFSIHTGWNFVLVRHETSGGEVGSLATLLLTVLALYVVYVLVLALFISAEHRVLKRELADEVELGVLPEWVLKVIPYYRRRVRGDWWAERTERTVIARLLTRLAFRKHAVRRLRPGEAELAGLEVVQLRSRARSILAPGSANEEEVSET